MFFFDPTWLIFAIPGLLLGFWAQSRVKGAFNKYSKVRTMRGITGAQVARVLLDEQGLSHVAIEETQGRLSDHYDPRHKVLRLSQGVYQTRSVAAVAIAAHELGHAMQDREGYLPLRIRTAMIPAVNIGSTLGWILIFLGIFLSLVFWGWVLGPLGAILAVPLTLFVKHVLLGPGDGPAQGGDAHVGAPGIGAVGCGALLQQPLAEQVSGKVFQFRQPAVRPTGLPVAGI